MTHTLTSNRPAIAAIAAVLALSTTPAMAQEVPGTETTQPAAEPQLPVLDQVLAEPAAPVASEIVTPEAAAPAPVIPAPSQATEVVQATPATPAPEAATPPAARAAPAPAAQRTAQPAAAPAVAQQSAPPAPLTTAPATEAPAPAPVVPAEPTTTASTANDDAVVWALGAGGVLIFGGLGIWALSRRRTVAEPVRRTPVATTPVAATASMVAPVSATPQQVVFEPVAPAPEAVVATPRAAASAAVATPRTAVSEDRAWRSLEDMVAAPPSPENPFLTRKHRMRRAKYILAHGAPEPIQTERQPAPEQVKQTQFRPQPAYDFGKAQNPPRFGWKPATS